MIGRSLFLMSICLVVAVVRTEDDYEEAATEIYGMCCNLQKALVLNKVEEFANCTDTGKPVACFRKYLLQVGNDANITKTAETVCTKACNQDNSTAAISEMENILKEENRICHITPKVKADRTEECLRKVLKADYAVCPKGQH